MRTFRTCPNQWLNFEPCTPLCRTNHTKNSCTRHSTEMLLSKLRHAAENQNDINSIQFVYLYLKHTYMQIIIKCKGDLQKAYDKPLPCRPPFNKVIYIVSEKLHTAWGRPFWPQRLYLWYHTLISPYARMAMDQIYQPLVSVTTWFYNHSYNHGTILVFTSTHYLSFFQY